MDHETCRDRLLELCYGELGAREASRVERHLQGCRACRSERDRLVATSRAMRALEAPKAKVARELEVLSAARASAEALKDGTLGLALRGFGLRLLCGTAFAALMVGVILLRVGRHPQRAPLELVPAASPPAESASALAPVNSPSASKAPSRSSGAVASPGEEGNELALGEPEKKAAPREPSEASPPEASSARSRAVGRDLAATPLPARVALGPVASEVERRMSEGELATAQRRFEPCKGGDVKRTAFIDRDQHVLKLVHDRADGVRVEEWFDARGRLSEAVVSGDDGAGPWMQHYDLSAGAERLVEASGPAPAVAPPLVERDPSGALFSGPGCGGTARP
ncbi:MAG TPA: zf-HC2 domain-containing protein [Anaeromyxobacteraceae bacterium]|nr:zf-HC2 domain-containing protein [Anaeromyxobacteraceae bacterium]